jgi:cell fate regulator YaaT (PSP1 superfamily)
MVDLSLSLEDLMPSDPEEPVHGGCGRCGSGELSPSADGSEPTHLTTAVRFGYMKFIGEFTYARDVRFTNGARVVIQTQRGIELGDQVFLSCSRCDRAVTPEQTRAWVDASGEDAFIFGAGRILREATAADLAEYARIQAGCRAKREFCQQAADRLGLKLKVVECECPFGGERIIFYFRADERVDFRAVVKELASEFRTRIEMRQVGARDEARLLADFETCGREVCCKAFLKTLKKIHMKMAKLQKATLDPSKVSGRCGRLKCCLRYEHMTYEELDKTLPRLGAELRTAHGAGVVVNRQVLTQLVQIASQDGRIQTVAFEDVFEVDGQLLPGKELPPPPAKPSVPERERRHKPRQRSREGGARARSAATSKGKKETEVSEKPEVPVEGGGSSSSEEPVDEQKGPRRDGQDQGTKPPQGRRRRGRRRPRRRGGSKDTRTGGGSGSPSPG